MSGKSSTTKAQIYSDFDIFEEQLIGAIASCIKEDQDVFMYDNCIDSSQTDEENLRDLEKKWFDFVNGDEDETYDPWAFTRLKPLIRIAISLLKEKNGEVAFQITERRTNGYEVTSIERFKLFVEKKLGTNPIIKLHKEVVEEIEVLVDENGKEI